MGLVPGHRWISQPEAWKTTGGVLMHSYHPLLCSMQHTATTSIRYPTTITSFLEHRAGGAYGCQGIVRAVIRKAQIDGMSKDRWDSLSFEAMSTFEASRQKRIGLKKKLYKTKVGSCAVLCRKSFSSFNTLPDCPLRQNQKSIENHIDNASDLSDVLPRVILQGSLKAGLRWNQFIFWGKKKRYLMISPYWSPSFRFFSVWSMLFVKKNMYWIWQWIDGLVDWLIHWLIDRLMQLGNQYDWTWWLAGVGQQNDRSRLSPKFKVDKGHKCCCY